MWLCACELADIDAMPGWDSENLVRPRKPKWGVELVRNQENC